MFNPTSPQELLELLKSAQNDKVAYTPEKYKYVIYVRKSTDETGKQIRSIEDQITECRDFARKNELKFADIIEEAESAKEPGIRPKFTKMLLDISASKYDGVIAWHPDRLARNMKEAGEVIDLVDKDIIKDLKFVSFTFSNDASGKLLLGIMFALSKEYSDKLSVNVKRGNRLSLAEGKYVNISKHGYIKDKNGYLRPDGNNYVLLKQGFQMRLEGKTLDQISEYLISNKYFHSNTESSERFFTMNKQRVQYILRDPVYTGVLQYGENVVNLMEYYDFIPMVTTEEFMQINRLSGNKDLLKLARNYRKGEDIIASLLRDAVICECGESLQAGITAKKTKKGTIRYFYYRCDNRDCPRYGKSIRAKVILDYIYHLLEKKPFSSKRSYEHYTKEIKKVHSDRINQAKEKLLTLRTEKVRAEEKIEKTKNLLLSDEAENIKKFYRGDLEKAERDINLIEEDEKKTRIIYENDKVSILTFEKFIELMENMPKTLASIKNMEELDFFLKKIFLNFYIKDKKVYKSTFNTPFDTLADQNVLLGAQERT
ncbi:MAG: Recombinase [Candidatus Nomurabacteria bacterium]|nr:Recombinase [Candidatus Nomurabacteria bacterium]